MECRVPSSVIIPAVAARLKHYLDVERKEVGFDLSIHQKDLDGKHRLYQPAGGHKRHQPQGRKENFLDNKLEASFRSYNGKSDWCKKVEINPDHKQQVQRRIREQISSFTVPEHFARNHVFLRDINWKGSDWTVHPSGIGRSATQAVSHGEFQRLVSSAAHLILATTLEHNLQHCHQQRSGRRSPTSVRVNTPTPGEELPPNSETSSLDEDSHIYCGQSVKLGLLEDQTVPGTSDNIDYEIAVHTTAKFQEGTIPSLFIRLYGQSGRSHTLFLQNPFTNITTSSVDQAFTFHVKTNDVGDLTDLSIGMIKKEKACTWYCKKVIVKKGSKKYMFPYNSWLSQCKTIKARGTGHVPAATTAQTATDRDTKNCQMKKDKYRPTTTKPQHNKNTSRKVSSEKLEFPRINDGKVEKKENNSPEINNKSVQSPRITEGNTSLKTRTLIRKYGPSERRPQGIPSSKKAKVLVSSVEAKTSGETSDQVTLMVDRCSTTITSDDSKEQPELGENNMDDVTSSNTSSDSDLTAQGKIQSPKCGRASSPARYVFFAFENKESSIIVEVNGCTKRSQEGSTGGKSRFLRRVSSGRANTGSQCSGENQEYISLDQGSSELALLQDILSESGNKVMSGSLDSKPFSSPENGADDDVNEGNIDDYDKLRSQPGCEAVETSGSSCSCGEHGGYETDSTLDEEYIFSDTSSDPEDDDSHSSSKFDVFGKGPEQRQEEHNDDVMKKSKHHICRQRRVESCSKNSNVFQRSLASIHNQDDKTLGLLCQSHFFLPSVTDEEGKTLLHHAAAQENPSICQVLLDTNIGLVNIDHQDEFGKTALHYAVQKGNANAIKILLDKGAKAEIPDKESKTVLDIALWKVQAT